MSEKTKRPHRAFEITIRVGADTWEDAIAELLRMAYHIEEHGPNCNSVSGGYSTNHTVTILQNPQMTHDRYFEQLGAYLAAKKEEPTS